ncbi:MAG TPA: response regulator [Acidimicrobiales bacterium]|nr:response regulator [Acidimicrobiales bacterium]
MSAADPQPTRVIVVDDEGDLRTLVRVTLEIHGAFSVVGEADTGNRAIELASRHQPDAVVLDLGLPDLHGTELLAAIRQAAPRSRIVVYTGSEAFDTTVVERADGYVVKGGDLEVLVQAILVKPQSPAMAWLRVGTDEAEVRECRRFLERHCREWNCAEEMVADAFIVASELVSNAIRHARTPSELRIRFHGGVLRIEVLDGAATMPQPRQPDVAEGSGRGLMLIAALAEAWGVDPHPDGKVTWAEIAGAA